MSLFSVIHSVLPIICFISPHGIVIPFVALGILSLLKISWKDISQEIPKRYLYFGGFLHLFMFIHSFIISWNWKVSSLQSLKSLILTSLGFCLWAYAKKEKHKFNSYFFVISTFLVCVLALVDYSFSYPLETILHKSPAKLFSQVSILLSVLIWPTLILLKKGNKYTPYIFSAIVFLSILSIDCDAPILGIATGSFILIISYLIPKFTQKFLTILKFAIPPLFFATPFLVNTYITQDFIQRANDRFPNISYIHRLHVWKDVSYYSTREFLLGHGISAGKFTEFSKKQKRWFFKHSDKTITPMKTDVIPTHPHNILLQIYLELGIIGVFFLCFFYFRMIQGMRRRFTEYPEHAPIYLAYFTAIQAIVWVNVSIWETWFLSTLWMTWAFMVNISKTQDSQISS